MTKRVCQRTTSPALPGVVVHGLLEMLGDGRDVTSLLNALPSLTLPPELVALRDLGAAINLADHWPVVHITKIPAKHARLAITALPAFSGIYVDPGIVALAWLDATLPPAMPITLVVSPEELGTCSAFAYTWGDRVTNVIVRGAKMRIDPVPDILARCVNVQSIRIEFYTPVDKYLDALSTKQLHTLQIDALGHDAIDTSVIVAWLQGPRATSLSLTCNSVRDLAALATAIQDCATLSSLRIVDTPGLKEALVTSSSNLHHITSLTLHDEGFNHDVNVGLLRKLDRTKVLSFSLEKDQGLEGDEVATTSVLDALAVCPALTTLSFTNLDVTADRRMTGFWPHLTTVRVRSTDFETPRELAAFVQWLSTSRCLKVVDLSGTTLQTEGLVELMRALPAWMARGLETLSLQGTKLGDDGAAIVAVGLASGKNQRPLTVDLTGNKLSIVSVKLLLATLGACQNVRLHLFTARSDADYSSTIQNLLRLHQLQEVLPGVFRSPSRSTSA
ncbi:hypothetical protein SDRG_11889 [Saprolegnia diclina VS20]|uniref:RNI-like protein n=1 Tax=Saprolegnia diclina (strain VS20) TaxID=1156394 RepID=T0RK36_SAPDV|nr:hypothetical protein SDRG_11889 [Saprolegnia diclina VS20]EQC30312.1 hypothetical protein SDRG_11889 [Saprolegnia diclina VS20]|eukprot:XP_008616165.1 hypothetical protein SDRG_11889 [Saprolegnia diclina VS20]